MRTSDAARRAAPPSRAARGQGRWNGRPVDHPLLLLLSDGRPNDCDRYASRYGIEDARQALVEARLQHISAYCFTVDREGRGYLPIIFGSGGYTIVQHPQQLPMAFVEWLRKAARHCAR